MTLEEQRRFILSGQMYNDLTPELIAARERAVFLTNQYNASFGEKADVREGLLRELLQSVGKNVHFEPVFRCEFGFNIVIETLKKHHLLGVMTVMVPVNRVQEADFFTAQVVDCAKSVNDLVALHH